MTLVMTLLARDEIDIVDSWLAFHLNAGVDLVIATDNRSQDGTTEVLEEYARSGHVHLIREPGEDLRQDEWVTRMARLAATDYGADWVINSDADEFWWPRGASLSEVLAAVPPRYGTVGAFLRVFCPRPGEEDFAERMTVRFSALAPINDPASLYKPIRKIIHRGHPEIRVTRGQPRARGQPVRAAARVVPDRVLPLPPPLGGPVRAQGEAPGRGVRASTSRDRRPPTTRTCSRRSGAGRIGGVLRGARRLRRGARARAWRTAGSSSTPGFATRYARSQRGRRPSRFPVPTLVEDAEYAVEAAVLGEADVVRLQRRLDELERRLGTVEQRLPRRAYRKLERTARRVLSRG